ncbi:MAG: hypothetical protein IKL28_04070 [Lachnospiraceae bacterium]|nr:hypothetical protein [Lachnospiraceae bacterium]
MKSGWQCCPDFCIVKDGYALQTGVVSGKIAVELCMEKGREQGIEHCYLWPADDSARKIYLEAGFRTVKVVKAGRAVVDRM